MLAAILLSLAGATQAQEPKKGKVIPAFEKTMHDHGETVGFLTPDSIKADVYTDWLVS